MAAPALLAVAFGAKDVYFERVIQDRYATPRPSWRRDATDPTIPGDRDVRPSRCIAPLPYEIIRRLEQ